MHSHNKLNEACGVFALSTKTPTDHYIYQQEALNALQHRGEDGAGISYHHNSKIVTSKSTGFVNDLIDHSNIDQMITTASIGHVRYGTQGSNDLKFVQPFFKKSENIALAFNGQLSSKGYSSDSEHLFMRFLNFLKQGRNGLDDLLTVHEKEAFSAVVIEDQIIYAMRDVNGTRPLFVCEYSEKGHSGLMIASETCVFNRFNYKTVREVKPGSLIILRNGECISEFEIAVECKRFCAFEGLYFSREDSVFYHDGNTSEFYYDLRKKLGLKLGRRLSRSALDADVVVGVPQSGLPASMGVSKQTGIPMELGLIKSRYHGRSFIQSNDNHRRQMIENKLQIQPSVVCNKSVLIVDDTLVRGNTMKHIVAMLRAMGAKEVHVAIAAPPIVSPCYKGVDTGRGSDLPLANQSIDDLRKMISADSLQFLNVSDLTHTLGHSLCLDCFNKS